MYEVTSTPLVKRTRATFRRAELGFLGVVGVLGAVEKVRRGGDEKVGKRGAKY